MRADRVVGRTPGVEVGGEVLRRVPPPPGPEFGGEGAVEAFDLALGLGMTGPAVGGADAQPQEPSLEARPTYKHDLFAYDDICLALKMPDDSWVEVSEEKPGFRLLVEEVERRYPEVPRDWLREVMVPAFARNYRVLWGVA